MSRRHAGQDQQPGSSGTAEVKTKAQTLDFYLRHITDLGHANRGEKDVIMTQIRDMSSSATWVGWGMWLGTRRRAVSR
jgi:hypothetical protein